MKLVYFDQNVVDHLLDATLAAPDLAIAMEQHGCGLVLSEHNFQEWALCWKTSDPAKEERGRRLLAYVLKLAPTRFLLPTPQLLRYEAARIIGSKLPGPWLPSPDADSTRQLLDRFVSGTPSDQDRRTLLENLRRKEETAASAKEMVQEIARRRLAAAQGTFDQFLAANPDAVKAVGRRLLEHRLRGAALNPKEREKTVKMVLRRMEKCPAFRTAVRANLYVNYRMLGGAGVSHDTWDDLRHCVSAAYSDVFVTGDEKLRAAYREIRPGAKLATTKNFVSEVGLSAARRP